MNEPLVYIIILNYQGYEDTIRCLESVFHNDYPNYKVIVLDNASPNNSEKYIRTWQTDNRDKEFVFVQTGSNLGFSGGNNVGIRYALQDHADYVWLLNNDTVIKKDSLSRLVDKMLSDSDIGICGSKLLSYYEFGVVQGLAGKYNPFLGYAEHILNENEISEMQYVIGASMLIKSEVFMKVGLLSEDYFLYFEELDMAMRIKGLYKQAVALDSIVYHKEGSSIGSDSYLSLFYLHRNALKFSYKYYKHFFLIVFVLTCFRIIYPLKRRPFSKFRLLLDVVGSFVGQGKKGRN